MQQTTSLLSVHLGSARFSFWKVQCTKIRKNTQSCWGDIERGKSAQDLFGGNPVPLPLFFAQSYLTPELYRIFHIVHYTFVYLYRKQWLNIPKGNNTSLYLEPYLLTPWCRVFLEKLTGLQLVKKFPAFHGTRRFITSLTSVRHPSLSWASPIQSMYPHPISWRSILILSTHLGLVLPSGLLHSGFPTKTLYTPSPHPCAPHAQPIS